MPKEAQLLMMMLALELGSIRFQNLHLEGEIKEGRKEGRGERYEKTGTEIFNK